MSRRRAGTLTPEEHRDLLQLTEESERLQAERIERLAEQSHVSGENRWAF